MILNIFIVFDTKSTSILYVFVHFNKVAINLGTLKHPINTQISKYTTTSKPTTNNMANQHYGTKNTHNAAISWLYTEHTIMANNVSYIEQILCRYKNIHIYRHDNVDRLHSIYIYNSNMNSSKTSYVSARM